MDNNNHFVYRRNGEMVLEKRDISNAICGAQMDFDEGRVTQCRDTLAEIVNALNTFLQQSGKGGENV